MITRTHSEGKKISQRSKPFGKYFSLTHYNDHKEARCQIESSTVKGEREHTPVSWKTKKIASMIVVGGPLVRCGSFAFSATALRVVGALLTSQSKNAIFNIAFILGASDISLLLTSSVCKLGTG